jgi:membrane protein
MAMIRKWYNVAAAAYRRIIEDDITSVAASIAFFILLAGFPALAAVVTLISIFVDPSRLEALVKAYPDIIPQGSISILMQQIDRLSAAVGPQEKVRTFTPYVGFAVLVWGTNKGTNALVRGLNTVFGCNESRSFVKFTAVTLAFTFGAIVFFVFSFGAVLLAPALLKMLGLTEEHVLVFTMLRWLVLLVVVNAVIAIIYRYGPNRKASAWRTTLIGSSLAALLWIASSTLFSWYISSFSSFTQLYGSLSAVIGFMVWIWLSSIAVLIGAELDAALSDNGVPASTDPRLHRLH